MAKIWAVYEGREPTIGGPWARLPAFEAATLFELVPEDFLSEPDKTPRFGDADRDPWYAGYKHIVVEVERKEKRQSNLLPGFYKSKIKPKEAQTRLIQHAVVAGLGTDNVVRVEVNPTTDSQGNDALKITVVLTPGATDRLEGDTVLDTLVKVHKQFHEMGDERTPIMEYATELELAQDGGPQS